MKKNKIDVGLFVHLILFIISILGMIYFGIQLNYYETTYIYYNIFSGFLGFSYCYLVYKMMGDIK